MDFEAKMIRFFQKYRILIPALAVGTGIFFSCTKKKTSTSVVSQPTKWETIAGHYKVYDTIPLRSQKTNINYYIEDVTPYYACDCRQIAVKQH